MMVATPLDGVATLTTKLSKDHVFTFFGHGVPPQLSVASVAFQVLIYVIITLNSVL